MMAIRALGSSSFCIVRTSPSDEKIHDGIIVVEVVMAIREVIPKLFGLFNTILIEDFDRRYGAITQDVSTIANVVAHVVGL